jgi:hypothetical protein
MRDLLDFLRRVPADADSTLIFKAIFRPANLCLNAESLGSHP